MRGGPALTIVLFLYAVMPAAIQNLIGGRSRISIFKPVTPIALSGRSGLVLQLLLLAGLYVAVTGGLRRMRLTWSTWVCLLPWGALVFSTLLATHRLGFTALLYVGAVLVGANADRTATLRTIGACTAVLAAVSLALAVVAPGKVLLAQADFDKSIFGDRLLAGPLYHPNALGQSLALGFPFLAMIERRGWRRAGVAATVVALVWSGSRTSMLAVGLALIVRAGWKRREKAQVMAVRVFTRRWLACVYVAVAVIGPLLVFSTSRDFSTRRLIWDGSLNLWRSSPIRGNGATVYSQVGETGGLGSGAFHGHNLLVHTLATAGLIGACALTVLVVRILRGAWAQGLHGGRPLAAWAVLFLAICWFEVPTDFVTPGTLSWVVWLPIVFLVTTPRQTTR